MSLLLSLRKPHTVDLERGDTFRFSIRFSDYLLEERFVVLTDPSPTKNDPRSGHLRSTNSMQFFTVWKGQIHLITMFNDEPVRLCK